LEILWNSDLPELARDDLLEWIPKVRAGRRPPVICFAFMVEKAVPASCILGHEHPELIHDPLLAQDYRPEEPVKEWRYGL